MISPIIEKLPDCKFSPVDILASIYHRFSHAFLLESVQGKFGTGRYSIIGFDPFLTIHSKGQDITIIGQNDISSVQGNPLAVLKQYMERYHQPKPDAAPLFLGGAVGFLSYDMCRFFEKLPCTTLDDLELQDSYFMFVDAAIVFDHLQQAVYLISTGLPYTDEKQGYTWAMERLAVLKEFIKPTAEIPPSPPYSAGGIITSNLTQAEFERIVLAAKEYIAAGDIFQVNLSQRLCCTLNEDPLNLYRKLRQINPSPFASVFKTPEMVMVGCSPERLVKLEGDLVQTRPIAGTRPRGKDKLSDAALSSELILSEKERAEHIMLVDLERNDLGRISRYGTVRADELMVIEDYSHVFHIVSNVRGQLRRGTGPFEVIRAVFPGVTITGTPKIRSMEIIDELEPTRRGPYTGSLGYISFSGDMDLNIIIRTFVIKNGQAYIQVGCGIVADSDPASEYRETLYKAQALLAALGL